MNFVPAAKFAQTQDLTPVQPFVYSIMLWRTKPFCEAMQQQGFAFFTGKVGYYPVDKLSAFIVKTAEDLRCVDYLAKALAVGHSAVEYDPLIDDLQLEDG